MNNTNADFLLGLDSNTESTRDKSDSIKIVNHPSLNSATALPISNVKSNLSNSISFNDKSTSSDYQRNDSKLLAKTEKIPRDSNQNDSVDDEWVSSITPTTDDPKMSSFTIRAICMGIIWALFLSIANTLFSFRQNPFRIPLSVVVLLSFPLGRFFQVVIPLNRKVLGIPLNPGPFTIKEHALVSLIAASASPHLAIDNLVVQSSPLYLGHEISFPVGVAWVGATQMVGYGVAGFYAPLLLKLVWPGVGPDVALFRSFHSTDTENDPRISRMNWFWLIGFGTFLYQLFPAFFIPSLQLISVLCLLPGASRTVKMLASADAYEGPGVFSISLDWTIIGSHGPMSTPFWAASNLFIGHVFFGWVVVPLLYFYYNDSAQYPILENRIKWKSDNISFPLLNSNRLYDANGNEVNLARLATSPDNTLLTNGPFYLSPIFLGSYMTSFLNIATVFTHVLVWYGKDIYSTTTSLLASHKPLYKLGSFSTHSLLLMSYRSIPTKYYGYYFAVFAGMVVIVTRITDFKLSLVMTILSLFLATLFSLPIAVITAISGIRVGINVILELIAGFLLDRGNIVGLMTFKSIGVSVLIQTIALLEALKMGQYLLLSPWHVAAAMGLGTVVGTLGSVSVVDHVLKNDPSSDGTGYRIFFAAASIFGEIGPRKFFGGHYKWLYYAFPTGLILPVIPFLLNILYPHENWILINFPLLTAALHHPGGNQATVLMPFLITFVFNFWIKRTRKEWWKRYNFVTASALSAGAAVAGLLIVLWKNIGSSAIEHRHGPIDSYCSS